MAAVTVKFSIVDYMQRLKKANFTDEQAEVLAKETEELISNVLEQTKLGLEGRELASKNDIAQINLTIAQLKKELISRY